MTSKLTVAVLLFFLLGGLIVTVDYRTWNTPRIRPKSFRHRSNKQLSRFPPAEEYVRQLRFNETRSLFSTAESNRSSEHLGSTVPTSLSTSTVVSKHSCQWRVQFWGKFKPSLGEGDYYCSDSDCNVQFITSRDYDVMKTSHVVLFHHRGNWDLETVERIRRPDQVLAFWTRETPRNSVKISRIGSFNWTVTYNARSEVQIPYGTLIRYPPTERAETTKAQTKNWAEGKKNLAIWISSNCHTSTWHRTRFVKSLNKFIKIDTFGRCGNQTCRKGCFQRIFSYKFYIAFENSICDDYISEKMWRNALEYDAVPIVYGPPKQDYERLAPKNSFIHISDFRNISSLVSYIKRLDQNDTLYNEFFEWRRDYRVEQLSENKALKKESLCSISKQLLNSKASHGATTENTTWFTKTCHAVPIPEMV